MAGANQTKPKAMKIFQSPDAARRAFEGLILRAANVVFATTNSGEIKRLIDERSQFDWSIVEEAAKATGGELLSPLLLSHRRMMIGDHKQLPPYRSDEMRRLLEDPKKVLEVITIAGDLIARTLKDPEMAQLIDDIEEDEEEGKTLVPLCAEERSAPRRTPLVCILSAVGLGKRQER
jgi:superfamily I DNA and/or RNA helicase